MSIEQHKLDGAYWDNRYSSNQTGWDIGSISTPLKDYIDQLKDKDIAILIPGCGNAYEAEYLLENGFSNITLIDISPSLVNSIKEKFDLKNGNKPTVICDDFFKLQQKFDLIFEQTFFCALDPSLRKDYVVKMHDLLNPGGKLVGLLFNRPFEGGPPFGGSKEEYIALFSGKFNINRMEACYNSILPRKENELFINLTGT